MAEHIILTLYDNSNAFFIYKDTITGKPGVSADPPTNMDRFMDYILNLVSVSRIKKPSF